MGAPPHPLRAILDSRSWQQLGCSVTLWSQEADGATEQDRLRVPWEARIFSHRAHEGLSHTPGKGGSLAALKEELEVHGGTGGRHTEAGSQGPWAHPLRAQRRSVTQYWEAAPCNGIAYLGPPCLWRF